MTSLEKFASNKRASLLIPNVNSKEKRFTTSTASIVVVKRFSIATETCQK
jgi:hypothetical protein